MYKKCSSPFYSTSYDHPFASHLCETTRKERKVLNLYILAVSTWEYENSVSLGWPILSIDRKTEKINRSSKYAELPLKKNDQAKKTFHLIFEQIKYTHKQYSNSNQIPNNLDVYCFVCWLHTRFKEYTTYLRQSI